MRRAREIVRATMSFAYRFGQLRTCLAASRPKSPIVPLQSLAHTNGANAARFPSVWGFAAAGLRPADIVRDQSGAKATRTPPSTMTAGRKFRCPDLEG